MNIKFEEYNFNPDVTNTPNTYDNNFKKIPTTSGIYFLVSFDLKNKSEEILYIGSAKNLKIRINGHEVKRILNYFYGYICVYFVESDQYKEFEKAMIKKYRPKFNTTYNG